MSDFDEKLLNRLHLVEREIERLKVWERTGQPQFYPLITPLTSTSWEEDIFSTTARTLLDLSTVFGVPAGVKAVLVYVRVRDSAPTSSQWLLLGPLASNYSGNEFDPILSSDVFSSVTAIIPCDANGDIYYQISASGADTMDITMRILGYWL